MEKDTLTSICAVVRSPVPSTHFWTSVKKSPMAHQTEPLHISRTIQLPSLAKVVKQAAVDQTGFSLDKTLDEPLGAYMVSDRYFFALQCRYSTVADLLRKAICLIGVMM